MLIDARATKTSVTASHPVRIPLSLRATQPKRPSFSIFFHFHTQQV
jgi:hypothetical protein